MTASTPCKGEHEFTALECGFHNTCTLKIVGYCRMFLASITLSSPGQNDIFQSTVESRVELLHLPTRIHSAVTELSTSGNLNEGDLGSK